MLWKLLNGHRINVIGAEELQARLATGETPLIVDVREPKEFARTHIPGARSIPLASLARRLGELDPKAETILVCRSDRRSEKACRFLAARGFTTAKNLAGGMVAWRGPIEQSFPVTR